MRIRKQTGLRLTAWLCALLLPLTGLAEMAAAVDEAEVQAVAEKVAREMGDTALDEAYFLEHYTFFATGYDFGFEMDEHTQDAALLGIAQLLNCLHIAGKYDQMNEAFDTTGTLTLDNAPSTETSFHLYGFPSHVALESSLLGESTVLLNMQGLLEFAMKLFNHMEIPAQRLALLYPYCTQDAMTLLRDTVAPVLFAEEGDREVSVEDLMRLCEEVGDLTYTDRALSVWMSALSSETGLGDVLVDAVGALPEWLEEELGEGGSLMIHSEGGTERWTVGETEVFTRSNAEDAAGWMLYLPTACYAEAITASYLREGKHTELRIRLGEEECSLDLTLTADNLPEHLNSAEPFTVDLSASGSCAEALPMLRYEERNGGQWLVCKPSEDGIAVRVDGSAAGVSLVDSATGRAMLCLHSAWPDHWPLDHWPLYAYGDIQGINVFSINDETMKDLLAAVLKPAVKGGVPLLAHAPISTVALLMDTAENAGILSAEGVSGWDE